ncbi:unnamed protein product [Brachionus calyciflorus]|uniref:Uncharacterized protein n=1 Tax=Brachionus calyciflorus TaxID=104777 RepID=A0A814L763_9BILA|nr:unnamed protein product [Brachionus calyciflorus]
MFQIWTPQENSSQCSSHIQVRAEFKSQGLGDPEEQLDDIGQISEISQVSVISQVCEDEITIEASCRSSSKTLTKDLTDDESDCDVSFMQDKFDELNIATIREKNKIGMNEE